MNGPTEPGMTIRLIRHGRAGKRGSWRDDMARPLDDVGRTQAVNIAESLSALQVERILSSPAVRCVQTVEPLASATGTPIEIVDALWEGLPVAPVLAMINRLAAAGSGAAVCSHGDTIPAVLEELALMGVPITGNGCAKGSVWELRVADGKVVEGRYLGRP